MAIDLTTRYLGLSLGNPLLVGACPLSLRTEAVRRCVDAGAAGVVMYSLFEEQVVAQDRGFSPGDGRVALDADSCRRAVADYIAHIQELRRSVDVPVMASLNGTVGGSWLRLVPELAAAGASALELNTYALVMDANRSAAEVEAELVSLVREAKSLCGAMPLTVKLSPFYSSLPHLAKRLGEAGLDGLVLFNRLYYSEFDVNTLRVARKIQFSTPADLQLRLRWISAVRPCFDGSLACSGGVHSAQDLIRALYAGADVAQVVSSVLLRGPLVFSEILTGLREWMETQGFERPEEVSRALNPERLTPSGAAVRATYIGSVGAEAHAEDCPHI